MVASSAADDLGHARVGDPGEHAERAELVLRRVGAGQELLDAESWQAPTLGARLVGPHRTVREPHPLENPEFPFSELVATCAGSPEHTFRREYLADFGAQGINLVFPVEIPTFEIPTTLELRRS